MTTPPLAKRNTTAVMALVLGLLASPMALPLGWFAREQIKRSHERGTGLSIAAIVLGSVSIIGWVVAAALGIAWWLSL